MTIANDQGPPQAEGAPIRKTDTPPKLPSVGDLTKSVRERLDCPSGAAKIYALMDARDEEIIS
jgi:hypothetical protein